MNVHEYITSASNKNTDASWLNKRIVCNDGFEISVQANEFAYCKPRKTDNDFYYEVECGFPSEKPDLIMEYAENSESPTDTVYGYVPIELVEELIASHGGIKNEINNE